MQLNISKKELYSIVKEALRDVIHEESILTKLKNIPFVSDEEMKEIITLHGKPRKRKSVQRIELDI